jgi:outer membrane protein, multidrug efflux system
MKLNFCTPVALIACLTGCASLIPVGPTPSSREATLDIPARWSVGKAGGGEKSALGDSLVGWWQRFDDPLMTDLVNLALLANPNVAKARAALRQAQALRDVAAAALLPTLGSSASVQRGIAGGDSTGNRLQLGLDGQWVPDIFGARRNALDASNAVLAASASSLGDVQVQLAAEVVLTYVLLRTTQMRWGIAKSNLTSQQETLQITDWRQQAGLVTMLEVERARAAAAQTQALLPALQIAIEQALHALAVLVSRPPGALQMTAGVAPTFVSLPTLGPALALSIPAETLRQRADVRAAEFQVAAAFARLSQAEAQGLPSFSIGGSIGLNAITLAALSKGTSLVASLLGSVTLPVFDGGALVAQVRVQGAAFKQAQQVYRSAVLGALKDVENALVALRGDEERLSSLKIAADAATNAALLARQRYSSGLVDFQTVLETQRTQLATQDGVVSARADISNDQVRLFTALGGGWNINDASIAIAR